MPSKYYFTNYPDGIFEIEGELSEILKSYKNWQMTLGVDLFESLEEAKQHLLDYSKEEFNFAEKSYNSAKETYEKFSAGNFEITKLEKS
jgi:hypothetical protein